MVPTVKSPTITISISSVPVKQRDGKETIPNINIFDVPWSSQTVAEIINQITDGRTDDQNLITVVLNNDRVIERGFWATTTIPANARLEIQPSIGFLGLGLLWAGVTAIVSWVVANAATIAIAAAFSYLGGVLFKQDYDQPAERQESENFSWRVSTTKQLGIPKPLRYGELLVHGNCIANWTDIVESIGDINREVIYMLIDHGYGPHYGIDGNTVYLNDQPSTNFSDASIYERLGTLDQTVIPGFEKVKNEYAFQGYQITNTDGPYVFTIPSTYYHDIEFTIWFPNGLTWYHDNGAPSPVTVGIKAEISISGENNWTEFYNEGIQAAQQSAYLKNIKFSEQAIDSPGFTIDANTRYDLRFTRFTADGRTRTTDKSYIKSIRTVIDIPFTKPGRALLGVVAVATANLNTKLDVKVVKKCKVVDTYNGSTWTIQYSNNRAWVVLDILTQPVISGTGDSGDPYTIDRYDGINPSSIDLAFFYEWAQFCDGQVINYKGSTESRSICNFSVDTPQSAFDLAYELAQVGRAKLFWEGTILTGWIDAAATNITDLVTCDNILAKTWKNSWNNEDFAGAIEVFYKDEDKGYERDSVSASNELAGAYNRIVHVEGSGETRWSGVKRVGEHALKRNQLIRNTNTFVQHKDAIRYLPGDVLRIQHTVPSWGKSYSIADIGSDFQTLTLDRLVLSSPGDLLYIRTYDGSSGVDNIVVTSYTIDTISNKTVTLLETLDPVPVERDIVAIGSAASGATSVTQLRRITKLTVSERNYIEVIAETYDTNLFGVDNVEHTHPNKDYVWPVTTKGPITQDRPITWSNITELLSEHISRMQPSVNIPWLSNVVWAVDSGGNITWTPEDVTDEIIFTFKGTTYLITAGSSDKEFIYWDPASPTVFVGTNDVNVAIASDRWVVGILKDGVAYDPAPVQLLHAGLILAGTIRADAYAQLRQTMPIGIFFSNISTSSNISSLYFKVPEETTEILVIKLSFRNSNPGSSVWDLYYSDGAAYPPTPDETGLSEELDKDVTSQFTILGDSGSGGWKAIGFKKTSGPADNLNVFLEMKVDITA